MVRSRAQQEAEGPRPLGILNLERSNNDQMGIWKLHTSEEVSDRIRKVDQRNKGIGAAMSPKFQRNDVKKLAQLEAAIKKMKQAKLELEEAAGSTMHWAEHNTIMHYANELGKVLTDDNDEAGLLPYARQAYGIKE